MNDQANILLRELFGAALEAVDPYQAMRQALQRSGSSLRCGGRAYDLDGFDRILVIGAGKAAAAMGRAIEEILDDRDIHGILVTKTGGGAPLARVDLREASHPVPDSRGIEATSAMLSLLAQADARTLVLCLLSGGGSALLVAPVAGTTLADKQAVTNLLLRAGADIGELNAVRKHLSAVKGGGLGRKACASTLVTLILSDVLGDRLDVIASGPTVPDGSTFGEAWAVLEKYRLTALVPEAVRNRLQRGLAGIEPETPKAGDPCFVNKYPLIIAGLGQALAAAGAKARYLGLAPEIVSAELRGEAREAAHFLAERARALKQTLRPGERRCLLSGGETTVTVTGAGTGGRNQELALAFAREIAGTEGITLLSAGTDGTDGPTDATGAVVDGTTVQGAAERGLDAAAHLERNDSYVFFDRYDALNGGRSHVKTGPTGTNVMDLQIMLVEG